jgi:hypothetical protein
MSNQFDTLKVLVKQYEIPKSDLFLMRLGGKDIPIITRTGIEKIQAKDKMTITYKLENVSPDHKFVIIKAIAMKDNLMMESYGEANPSNCKQSYPVAIAEKRAKARVVLMMSGFYREGLYSEDEFEPETIKQNRLTHEHIKESE